MLCERITLAHLLASLRYISLHVHMQGYKQYKGFIIAQAPMQFTCRDFWKMVYERECGVVVMLSDLVENGRLGHNQGFIQDFFLGGERLCAGKLISCGHRLQPPRGVWGHAPPKKF